MDELINEPEAYILGGGIAGISAAHHLKLNNIESVIFEKEYSFGGLCDSFSIDGFRFDKFIHLSFTKNIYVKKLFSMSSGFIKHPPVAFNYCDGVWCKHPLQTNLFNLSVDEKISVIKGLINSPKYVINNYEDFLKCQFGNYFAEKYPMRYTKKYWTVHPSSMETKWIGERLHIPDIEDVLKGAMSDKTGNNYYADEMRYPVQGGFKSFLNEMLKNISIRTGKEVTGIDLKKKLIKFSDNTQVSYKKIISTIPLPKMCRLIKDAPKEVMDAAQNLLYTSGVLVSLGFNNTHIPKHLWFYLYDENIHASRVYSPSFKSPDNVPKGCSSLQAEIYFSKEKPLKGDLKRIEDETINQLIEIGLFEKKDLILKDTRIIKYANVVYKHDIYKNRSIILEYLNANGVISAGRFGEWEYYWSDQSLLSGQRAAERLLELKS